MTSGKEGGMPNVVAIAAHRDGVFVPEVSLAMRADVEIVLYSSL